MASVIYTIAENTGIIIGGNVLAMLLSMASNIVLVRYLGAGDFGTYSFVFAFLGFFGIVMDMGTSRILLREISADESRAGIFVGNAIIMRLVLSLVAVILACGIISFLQYPVNTKTLVYIASLGFFLSFGGVYPLIFQGKLKMVYPTLVLIIAGVIRLLVLVYLVFIHAGLFWFVCATPLMEIPGIVLIMFVSRRIVRPKFKFDVKIWKYLLRESWPIALTATFIMIYTRIDQLMLYQMKGDAALGSYSAVVKITEMFTIIPGAFMASVFPLFSRYFVSSGRMLEKAYTLSFKYMSAIILPLVVGMCFFAEPVVRLVYGQQYVSAASTLQILMWSEIFVFVGIVHLNLLISVGLQKMDFLFTSTGAVVNIVLNLILIPRYGIAGAALATVISYVVGLPMSCSFRKTRPFGFAILRSLGKPLVAAIAMGLCMYNVSLLRFPAFFVGLSGVLMYCFCIIIMRGLDKEDVGYFRHVLLMRRSA